MTNLDQDTWNKLWASQLWYVRIVRLRLSLNKIGFNFCYFMSTQTPCVRFYLIGNNKVNFFASTQRQTRSLNLNVMSNETAALWFLLHRTPEIPFLKCKTSLNDL